MDAASLVYCVVQLWCRTLQCLTVNNGMCQTAQSRSELGKHQRMEI